MSTLNPPSLPYTGAVGVPQVMHIYDALHGHGTMAIIAKQSGVVRAYTGNTMQVFPGQIYSAAAWFRAEGVSAQVLVGIEWRNALDQILSTTGGLVITDTSIGWLESVLTSIVAPSNSVSARMMLELRDVLPGDVHYVEDVWFGRGVYAGWSAPAPDVVMNIATNETNIVGGQVGTPTVGYQMLTIVTVPAIESDEDVPAPHFFEPVSGGTGIPSDEVFGIPTLTASSDWWSARWPYRRAINIEALGTQVIPVNHPVAVELSIAIHTQGKLRDDFADIEVLHHVDGIWRRLPRSTIQVGSVIEVRFLTDVPVLPLTRDVYYVYHGALGSSGEGRAPFVDNPWPIVVPHDDLDVSYTRPREHWRFGVTSTPGARATFEFDGVSVRAVSVKGPDDAMAEVQLDNGPWELVDLFSPEEMEGEVRRWEELEATRHRLRFRATGRRNPSSGGSTIDLLKFEFVASVGATVGAEEVLTDRWAGSGVGGG